MFNEILGIQREKINEKFKIKNNTFIQKKKSPFSYISKSISDKDDNYSQYTYNKEIFSKKNYFSYKLININSLNFANNFIKGLKLKDLQFNQNYNQINSYQSIYKPFSLDFSEKKIEYPAQKFILNDKMNRKLNSKIDFSKKKKKLNVDLRKNIHLNNQKIDDNIITPISENLNYIEDKLNRYQLQIANIEKNLNFRNSELENYNNLHKNIKNINSDSESSFTEDSENISKIENIEIKKHSQIFSKYRKIDEILKKPNYKKKTVKSFNILENKEKENQNTKLSFEDLEILESEMLKPQNQRNYGVIEKLIKNLKFFAKFSSTIREKIIESSRIIKKDANTILFKEGDYGDLMYIIIRETYNIVINSYYDGDHFGDLAMMTSKQTQIKKIRKESKFAVNSLTLVDVRAYLKKFYENKNIFYENYLNESQLEEEKNKLDNFERSKNKSFFGLKELKGNQYERTKRTATIETSEETIFFALDREKYQRIFFSVLQKSLDDKIEILLQTREFEAFEPHVLLPFAYYLQEKKLKLGEILISKGELLDKIFILTQGVLNIVLEENGIVLKTLKFGDLIGGRALLNENYQTKLKVVSDAPNTIVFFIEKTNFELVPLDLKNKIRSILRGIKEFDEGKIEDFIEKEIKWKIKAKNIMKEFKKESRKNLKK